MASLGPYLRELRERRGLSLEEMVRATRVATRYLEALEADDVQALPAPAFTKGFIRAWCQVVGVDPAEALARYQALTGAPVSVPVYAAAATDEGEAPARSRSHGTVLVSFVLLVVLGLALFAVTLVLQSGRDRGERQAVSEPPPTVAAGPSRPGLETPSGVAADGGAVSGRGSQPVPEARSRSTDSPPAGTPMPAPTPPPASAPPAPRAPAGAASAAPSTASPAPSAASPTAAAPLPPPSSADAVAASVGTTTSPYRLVARVNEPTWIRVRMEDGRSTEETIPAGEIREWVSNGPFVLTVGNAGGIALELNGRALPPLGPRGAVIPRLVIPPTGQ